MRWHRLSKVEPKNGQLCIFMCLRNGAVADYFIRIWDERPCHRPFVEDIPEKNHFWYWTKVTLPEVKECDQQIKESRS